MNGSDSNDKGRDRRLIERFLEMMSAERGAARNTLGAYERDLSDYGDFLEAEGASLRKAKPEQIRNYLARLAAKGLKSSSAARKLSAVRQFHKFLYGEGIARENPAAAVDAPRLRRPLPKVMTEEEVIRLIELASTRIGRLKGKARLKALRLHCLLELLYASGLRVSELVALKKQALANGAQFITVKGKGGRERLVPVSARASAAVSAYLAALQREGGDDETWLFPSHGGPAI
jgi:integrase/recombinase XerD